MVNRTLGIGCFKRIKLIRGKILLLSIFAFCFQISFSQPVKKGPKQKLASINETWSYSNLLTYDWGEKTEYIYDAQGRLLTEWFYYYYLDGGRSEWYGTRKHTYTRDGSGHVILELNSGVEHPFSIDYKNSYKNEFTYDNNGNKLSDIFSIWNNKTWVNYTKVDFTYDGKNQLVTRRDFNWDSISNKWKLSKGSQSAYDNRGNPIKLLYIVWDSTFQKFDSSEKFERTFDSNNNWASYTSFRWNNFLNQWDSSQKFIFSYDMKGNRLNYTNLKWDTTKGNFFNTYKTEFLYDSKNNNIGETHFQWDTIIGGWGHYQKDEYLYDTTVTSDQLILPFNGIYYHRNLKNKILRSNSYYWDQKNSIWIFRNQTKYDYSKFVIITQDQEGLLVFPNPCSGIVNIEVQNHPGELEIKMFDMVGKLMLTEIKEGSGSMNVDGLKKGLYTIQVFEDNRLIGVRKLIIDN